MRRIEPDKFVGYAGTKMKRWRLGGPNVNSCNKIIGMSLHVHV